MGEKFEEMDALSTRQAQLVMEQLFLDSLTGTRTDFTIICGSRELHAHESVLRAASPFFESLFSAGMQESQRRVMVAVLQRPSEDRDLDVQIVRIILKFIYTGKIDVANADLYPSLMEQVNLWQLNLAVDEVETLMISRLSTSPHLWNDYLNIGIRHDLYKLCQAARDSFYAHAVDLEMNKVEGLVKLPLGEILKLVTAGHSGNCGRSGKDTKNRYLLVVEWINANKSERIEYATDLLDEINLVDLPADQIHSLVTNPLWADNGEVAKLILRHLIVENSRSVEFCESHRNFLSPCDCSDVMHRFHPDGKSPVYHHPCMKPCNSRNCYEDRHGKSECFHTECPSNNVKYLIWK